MSVAITPEMGVVVTAVMGGYSRHDAKEAMMEQARGMMDSATSEREREAIRRFMAELERD